MLVYLVYELALEPSFGYGIYLAPSCVGAFLLEKMDRLAKGNFPVEIKMDAFGDQRTKRRS